MTWGTLAIELSLPFALFIPATRRLAIAAGWFLHLGIFLVMTVPHYSLAVATYYLLFFVPEDLDVLRLPR
jgi:hypothetical protein